MNAVDPIKSYDLNDEDYKELKGLIIEMALIDRVFGVKKAAFLLCQKNKLKKMAN